MESVHQRAQLVLADISHVPENVSMQVDGGAQLLDLTATGPGCRTAGLRRKRQGDDTSGPKKAGTNEANGRAATPEDASDLVHRCVRMTALIYCQSMLHRVPIS